MERKDEGFSKELIELKKILTIESNMMKRGDSLINVFHLDSGEGDQTIEFAILKTFMNSRKKEYYKNLKLALIWDRIDIAKSEIFTGNEIIQDSELTELMEIALINDNPQFVELFLEKGVGLGYFLTKAKLLNLYNSDEVKKSAKKCPLFVLYDKQTEITFNGLKSFIKKFIFNDFHAEFFPENLESCEKPVTDTDAAKNL